MTEQRKVARFVRAQSIVETFSFTSCFRHDGAMPNQHIHSLHAGSKLGDLARWGYAQSTHTLTPCWLKVGRSGTMGLCPINTYTHSMLAQSWAIWNDGAMSSQHIHSLHAGSKLGDLARWGYAQSTHTLTPCWLKVGRSGTMGLCPINTYTHSMLAQSWAIWHDGAMPNQHIHSLHAGSKLGDLARWGYVQSTHTLTPCWLKVGRSGTMGLCPVSTYTHSMLAQSWAIWHDGAMPNQHIHSLHAGSKLGDLARWGYAQSTHTLTPCWLKVGRSGTMGLCPVNTYTHSMLAQSWAIWHDGAMPNQHIHSLHAGLKLGDLARWGYAQSTHTLTPCWLKVGRSGTMGLCPVNTYTHSMPDQSWAIWHDGAMSSQHIHSLHAGSKLGDLARWGYAQSTHTLTPCWLKVGRSGTMGLCPINTYTHSMLAQSWAIWHDGAMSSQHIHSLHAGSKLGDLARWGYVQSTHTLTSCWLKVGLSSLCAGLLRSEL